MTTPPREGPAPAVEIDEGRWPLVLITFRGIAPDHEFDAYLEALTRIVSRGEPLVLVLDATRSTGVPPRQRRQQAEWQREHADLLRRNVIGSAFVINSALIRDALAAILWFAPLPQPYHVAATRGDAERWVTQKLRAAGLEAP